MSSRNLEESIKDKIGNAMRQKFSSRSLSKEAKDKTSERVPLKTQVYIMTDQRKEQLKQQDEKRQQFVADEAHFKANNSRVPPSTNYIYLEEEGKSAVLDGFTPEWFMENVFDGIIHEIV